jgi:hypothetical protein
MSTRDRRRILLAVLIAWYACLAAFVVFSPLPTDVVARVEVAILLLAVLGIPLGIVYGSQDKFWT